MTASTNYFGSLNEIGQLIHQLFINGVINEDYARNAMIAQHVNDLKNNSIRFNSEGSVKANNPNISRKSNKQRKHKQDKQLEIEKYLSAHPEVLNKYFSEYVKKNLKIDWVVKEAKSDYFNSTKRYALGLFDNGKLISESTLVLNLNNF